MKSADTLKTGFRLLAAKMTGRRIPLQMHIRVTDRCNLRCKYCFGDYPVRKLRPPDTRQLFTIIDALGRMGTKRITFTGGEPLLRDDIEKIVHRAHIREIEASLTTNGILIDRHPDLLRELDQLTISIDGGKVAHDTNRGEGSWEKAMSAVRAARAAGTPVQLLCTVTSLTALGLKSVFEIADRYACSVTFDLLAPRYNPDGSMTAREETAPDESIHSLLESLIRNPHPRAVFSESVLRYLRDWPVSYSEYRLEKKQLPPGFRPIPCSAGRFFGIIETNGDLFPCCRMNQNYQAPNVLEVGVEEAWRVLPPHGCSACCSVGFNMFNSLFALQPAALLHFLRHSPSARKIRKITG